MTPSSSGKHSRRNIGRVGFYGCTDQLVRCTTKITPPPRNIHVSQCPACDREHPRVSPMWRLASSQAEVDAAEVTVN